jgi:hypothetical protein
VGIPSGGRRRPHASELGEGGRGYNQAAALRQQSNDTLLGGAAQLLNIWSAAPHGVGRTPPSTGIPQAAYGTNDYTRNYRARITAPTPTPAGWNG